MKAAIYTRISTDNQAEVELNSCETQETKIRSFISSQDSIQVYKVYSDQGYSGASIERPALSEMLDDIQNNRIDLVISYKIDRLTRSPRDFYQLIEIFEKYNVSFISITERFDTSTPSGRLLRNIMLTFAQFERELISERIRDKMLERAKKGMFSGGRVPIGYKRENKKLVIEPKEAEVVKTIYMSFLSNPSIGEIYSNLKERKLFNRINLPFSKTAITTVLDNPLYIGKLAHKGIEYQGIHKPIINEKLFEEVKFIRDNRIRPKKGKVYNNSLFPGIIQCKECGSIMTCTFSNKTRNGKQIRYYYYRCSSVEKRDRSFCSIKEVSSDRLDEHIIDFLDKSAKNNQYIDSLIFLFNHNAPPVSNGLEPSGVTSIYDPKRLVEILKTIVGLSHMRTKEQRLEMMKRHIENIIYSKETIEVNILYSKSENDGADYVSSRNNDYRPNYDAAACRHLPAAPTRLSTALVCRKDKLERGGFEPP